MNNNPYSRKDFGKQRKSGSDLYDNYDLGGTQDIIASTVSQKTGKSPTLGAMGTSGGVPPSQSGMRPPTGSFQGSTDGPRPMTSVKGAGFTSAGNRGATQRFDPFQQAAAQGPAPPLEKKSASSPPDQARDMEHLVNHLIEESATANVAGDFVLALEKAKEAGKKERTLCKHREKNGLADSINYDLTYAVLFNLANQYHSNKMYSEALSTYLLVVKNKQYPQAGRLRVNMGNIYYEQKKYPSAIKMYRMAMDLIGTASREMRFKIMRNIGNSFVRLGRFQDAIQSYEAIMEAHGDPQTGFNLIVCYYAIGDKDKMKKGFMQLLSVQEFLDDEEEEEEEEDKNKQILNMDDLRKDRKARKKVTNRYVKMAAKLIAPMIQKDMPAGFDWVIEYLRTPRRPNSPGQGTDNLGRQGFPEIAMEMEIAKGIAFLKKKNYQAAIEVFKSFEKKDQGLIDQAATNLAFLYFLEGDLKNTEKYAELAVKADRYNAKALVNRSNYIFAKGDLEGAKELYLEAIGVEADCVEAIYNLGLANKRLNNYQDALQAFKKLHRIIPKDPQVIYHIGNLFDLIGDIAQAEEWFKILHGVCPSDPKALARLGALYNKENDETNAFHNFSDSYNVYPVNMEVITWLGVWYVKSELYEDAIPFFERAAEIEPQERKWQLMVASCYRRMGAFQKSGDLYKLIHKNGIPRKKDEVECLKYLCAICKDLNDNDYDEYNRLLQQAEREHEEEKQRYGGHQDYSGGPPPQMNQGQYGDMQSHGGQPPYHGGGQQQQQQPPQQQQQQSVDMGATKRINEQFQQQVDERQQDGPTIKSGGNNDEEDWGDDDLELPM